MAERNITVDELKDKFIEDMNIELVERKGLGHPDSICDGIADSMSKALCREYLKRFGIVMHHNTDETQLVAGASKPAFRGGKIIEPIYILLVGRATTIVDGEVVPVAQIVTKAAADYLKENFREIDVENHVKLDCKIGSGSADLQNVFKLREDMPGANDTSFGIGYAPLSDTEKLVLESEGYINSPKTKDSIPALGTDVKVMGLREGEKITLTVATAMVDKYVDDLDAYRSIKEELRDNLLDLTAKITNRKVEIFVNMGDSYDKGERGIFLTVTGTSAESGDDGSVGRGNRVSGLITPNRPMSMEAAAGKNPINHVGKIYNILSFRIANRIVEEIEGVKQVHVRLLSQIGKPIDCPRVASLEILPEEGINPSNIKREAKSITDEMLANIKKVTEDIIHGKVQVF